MHIGNCRGLNPSAENKSWPVPQLIRGRAGLAPLCSPVVTRRKKTLFVMIFTTHPVPMHMQNSRIYATKMLSYKPFPETKHVIFESWSNPWLWVVNISIGYPRAFLSLFSTVFGLVKFSFPRYIGHKNRKNFLQLSILNYQNGVSCKPITNYVTAEILEIPFRTSGRHFIRDQLKNEELLFFLRHIGHGLHQEKRESLEMRVPGRMTLYHCLAPSVTYSPSVAVFRVSWRVWPAVDNGKDSSQVSREHYDVSSKWPPSFHEISNHEVYCTNAVARTHYNFGSNDQVYSLKVGRKLTLSWKVAIVGLTAWNWKFEGRLGSWASTKYLSCYGWSRNRNGVVVTEL